MVNIKFIFIYLFTDDAISNKRQIKCLEASNLPLFYYF